MDQQRNRLEAALDQMAGRAWSSEWRNLARRYLALIAAIADPAEKSAMLCELAAIFRKRARLRNKRHASRYAIARAGEALRLARTAADVAGQANALGSLANIHQDLGDRHADEAHLARAEALFLEGLAILDPTQHVELAGDLKHKLAGVHAVRHRIDGAARHLEAARPLYRDVRRAGRRAGRPLLWIKAALNLVRMERDAADGHRDPAALRRVAGRLRRILRVSEHLAFEEVAADVRHALAIALAMSADLIYDHALLAEASRLWEANTRLWTRADREFDWARMQNSLAIVSFTIGEKENDPAMLRRALGQFRALIEPLPQEDGGPALPAPWSPERAPEHFAYAIDNIANLRRRLAVVEADPSYLRAALLELVRAAETFDSAKARHAHASIIKAIGSVEAELGAMTRDAPLCARGERTQRKALRLLMRLRKTGDVVIALNDLGTFLLQAAPLDRTPATLERARAYLRRASVLGSRQATTAPAMQARRELLTVRLALAARRAAIREADALACKIERTRLQFAVHLDPAEATALDLLLAEARALGARLAQDPARCHRNADALRRLLDGRELPRTAAISCRIELGRAFMALGQPDDAIAAWQSAQDRLWEHLAEIEGAGARGELVRLAAPSSGASATHRLGDGTALGDELALAFLARGGAGDTGRALAAIERSRAMLRALAAIPEGLADPHLASLRDALRAAHAECESLDRATLGDAGGGPAVAAFAARRQQQARDRAAAAETAFRRALSELGISQIAVPDPTDLATALPPGGCLVIFAVGTGRGAAIVLRAGARDLESRDILDLPALTRPALDQLLGATGAGGVPDPAAFLPAVAGLRQRADLAAFAAAAGRLDSAIVRLGDRLWDIAMGPLDARLRDLGLEQGADIALMAPGVLAALPLHAAWRRSAGAPRAFLDDWTVRFVPDLRSVLAASAARRAAAAPPGPARLLVIQDPCGDGFPPDPAGRVLDAGTVTRIVGPDATVDSVTAALSRHGALSFTGHAIFEPLRPDRSGLALAHPSKRDVNGSPLPEILSIAALRRLSATPRGIAVLAACDTATAETADAADELNGLPAELIDAGFTGVVGASWPVDDAATDSLMTRFWNAYRENGHNAAAALRQAQLAMRGNLPLTGVLRAIGSSATDRDPIAAGLVALPAADAPFCWAAFRVIGG